MKAVMMSIQPKWCELIANGKKTVEVKKTKPKIKTPFKVYIYCTTTGDLCYKSNNDGKVRITKNTISRVKSLSITHQKFCNGKVIGEFVCDEIEILGRNTIFNAPALYSQSRLTKEEYFDYIGNKTAYIWHISDLAIYDKPKELSEFFVYCDRCDKRPIACEFAYEESNENGYYSECKCDFKHPIKRPPQSWCYVEELK